MERTSLRKPVSIQRDRRRRRNIYPLGTLTLALFAGVPSVAHATSAPRVVGDYDGDGKTDIAVWRPSSLSFYWISSKTGASYSGTEGLNPQLGDIPVSGDYDGDGKTDFALWRPGNGAASTNGQWPNGGDWTNNGMWYIKYSTTNTVMQGQWGAKGDIPISGDFDGDGKSDLAIWRPSTGVWWWVSSQSGDSLYYTYQWGVQGDIPIVGDYDGDGKADYAIWRPSTATWYWTYSSTGAGWYGKLGLNAQSTDIPVVGDYDGDGKTDFAMYRPSAGRLYWYGTKSGTVSMASLGENGCVPMAGDYDGHVVQQPQTDAAVWQPSSGTWYWFNSSGLINKKQWGNGGSDNGGVTSDIPLPHSPEPAQTGELDVELDPQQESNWCGLACAQMIASYFSVQVVQCNEANIYTGRTDCCTNASSAGNQCNQTQWPQNILAEHGFTYLASGTSGISFQTLQLEIAANRPVDFIWNWSGGGAHSQVAIGAWVDSNGTGWVSANNPDPQNVGDVYDLTYSDFIQQSQNHTTSMDIYDIQL